MKQKNGQTDNAPISLHTRGISSCCFLSPCVLSQARARARKCPFVRFLDLSNAPTHPTQKVKGQLAMNAEVTPQQWKLSFLPADDDAPTHFVANEVGLKVYVGPDFADAARVLAWSVSLPRPVLTLPLALAWYRMHLERISPRRAAKQHERLAELIGRVITPDLEDAFDQALLLMGWHLAHPEDLALLLRPV